MNMSAYKRRNMGVISLPTDIEYRNWSKNLTKWKIENDSQLAQYLVYDLGEAAAWDNLVALKNEAKKLSQLEQVILFEYLLEKKTITQLVEECGVPRITLKRLKKQLLQKLRNVMEK